MTLVVGVPSFHALRIEAKSARCRAGEKQPHRRKSAMYPEMDTKWPRRDIQDQPLPASSLPSRVRRVGTTRRPPPSRGFTLEVILVQGGQKGGSARGMHCNNSNHEGFTFGVLEIQHTPLFFFCWVGGFEGLHRKEGKARRKSQEGVQARTGAACSLPCIRRQRTRKYSIKAKPLPP